MLNSFTEAVADSRVSQAEKNYEQMRETEIKDAWEKQFHGWVSSFEEANLNNAYDRYNLKKHISSIRERYNKMLEYRDDCTILDKVYGRRTHRKTLLELCDLYESRIAQVEQAEQEHQESLNKFKEALAQNNMVADMVNRINSIGYSAEQVCLNCKRMYCYSDKEKNEFEITYKKYGYPDLSDEQLKILGEYLINTLDLKFVFSNRYSDWPIVLSLYDAPGGMKSSW